MSKSHIEGFLADVRRANPSFSESSAFGLRKSSLHGLLEYLRHTSGNPVPFAGRNAAIQQTGNPNDARLAKYDGAIRALVAVWGKGGPYPGQEVPVGRLMFRGDTRGPDVIFVGGFSPRQPGPLVYRSAQQDIDPQTAVAMAADPRVAANFPLPDAWGPLAFQRASGLSWVYALYLEKGYNTSGQQGLNFVDGNGAAGNLLYAGEMASSGVPANHVLGALQVWRNFIHMPGKYKPAGWFAHGVYRFIKNTWQENPGYTGPAAFAALVPPIFRYTIEPFLSPTAPVRGPQYG